MVKLSIDASDDLQFIELAVRAITGEANLVSAAFLHVVKIDSWFGDNWFMFAGKAVGALGVHDRNLKVPPFHPHRVVSEARFRLTDPPEQVDLDEPLHTLRPSMPNLKNPITRVGSSTTVGWYSGNTAVTGRGSLMVYASTAQGGVGWYAGLERRKEWDLVRLVGADPRHWQAIVGGRCQAAESPAP